ncbi:MAG: DNA-deoxyinosine glycosylase [Roseburia sp.]|nr:DNA-deoxyinosine glycosylase [Roseburia sp.]
MQTTYRNAKHDEVPPLIDERCDTLVLGSMLSPKSAEQKFYYAHPQNRFWRVLARVFDREPCFDIPSRKELALSNGIALWDVISSCDIIGASDSTIKNVTYNDIAGLLSAYPNINRIFTTGKKSHDLLMRYNKNINHPIIAKAVSLPSTSPLNCGVSLTELVFAYSVLRRRSHTSSPSALPNILT